MSSALPAPDGGFSECHNDTAYRSASLADAESIVQLCLAEFYPRMPLFHHLGATKAEDVETTLAVLPVILSQGASLVAVDASTGELVGARLSVVVRRAAESVRTMKHPLLTDPSLATKYPKHSQIARLVDRVESMVDYFEAFPDAESALAFKLLVVKATSGRRGIGKRLVESSMRLGRQLGLSLAVGSTESRHSQRIYEDLGFDRLAEISYAEYVDPVTGDRPFSELARDTEHKAAVMFAKQL